LIDTNVAVSFFLMRKITTLSLSITYLLLLTTVYSYSAGVYDQSNIKLIPGSNTPVVKDCLGLNYVYIYDDYVIYTQKSGDYEGSNIYIFHPQAQNNDPCSVSYPNAEYTINAGEFGGANTFSGVYGNLLFMDQWTGRNFKRLLAINMDSKSLVFFDTYTEPTIKDNKLNYFRTLKAKRQSVRDRIPCPKATQWESQGKQVLYVEKMSVDLSTMKKEPSGVFSCMPTDPIGTAAPKKYGH